MPVTLHRLHECHDRIRRYARGMLHLSELLDPADPRIGPSLASLEPFLRDLLPLHAQDEEESVRPRLPLEPVTVPPGIDWLEAEHEDIERLRKEILRTTYPYHPGITRVPAATLRTLSSLLMTHIEREERVLFPLLANLTPAADNRILAEMALRRSTP
jgi:iron-sulfur cluster repair protein YtfE (RIC family)